MLELGGERFIVSHHQGGTIGGLDDLGGGVGLARSRNPKQDLMLLAIEDAASERFDGSSLIALGLVAAYQLEIHKPL